MRHLVRASYRLVRLSSAGSPALTLRCIPSRKPIRFRPRRPIAVADLQPRWPFADRVPHLWVRSGPIESVRICLLPSPLATAAVAGPLAWHCANAATRLWSPPRAERNLGRYWPDSSRPPGVPPWWRLTPTPAGSARRLRTRSAPGWSASTRCCPTSSPTPGGWSSSAPASGPTVCLPRVRPGGRARTSRPWLASTGSCSPPTSPGSRSVC